MPVVRKPSCPSSACLSLPSTQHEPDFHHGVAARASLGQQSSTTKLQRGPQLPSGGSGYLLAYPLSKQVITPLCYAETNISLMKSLGF